MKPRMTKPRKHGSDKNHAKRSTRIQKLRNDELKQNDVFRYEPYLRYQDNVILNHLCSDRTMAVLWHRSLYAIRARRKRLKQTMNLSDTRDVRRQAETLVVNP